MAPPSPSPPRFFVGKKLSVAVGPLRSFRSPFSNGAGRGPMTNLPELGRGTESPVSPSGRGPWTRAGSGSGVGVSREVFIAGQLGDGARQDPRLVVLQIRLPLAQRGKVGRI